MKGSERGFKRGLLRWFSGKESACQDRRCRRCKFDPWIGKKPRRGKWQPTPAFLPGESNGQRSRAGYSPWGHKELDTTEHARISLLPTLPGADLRHIGCSLRAQQEVKMGSVDSQSLSQRERIQMSSLSFYPIDGYHSPEAPAPLQQVASPPQVRRTLKHKSQVGRLE